MNPYIHTCKTPGDLADLFAIQLISWVNETEGDIFHLALSGGKTPSLLFSLLAEKYSHEVPWQKIHFWWGDERMVVPDDPESNYGVVNQLLFSHIKLSKSQIHRIKGEADPTEEAKRYGLEIKSLIPVSNGWPVFDLIMLGLGDDGHTASIFPNQMQLLKSQYITGIAFHPVSGQKRITLTGNVINNAKRVAFLISGESKSQIFNEIINDHENSSAYPASHIHPQGELHWFVC
ncbi:MAG TPA: 6-phosphogluconolactonase [Prolixibacteraceae bacterium]|jgi:6-phosphogluconolactonase